MAQENKTTKHFLGDKRNTKSLVKISQFLRLGVN